jgi:hypothetical protein
MKMNLKNFVFLIIFCFVFSINVKAQDTTTSTPLNRTSSTPNVGGLFISPMIGFAFPIKALSNNSEKALTLGVKLEFASSKLYPFIIGGFFEHAKYPGQDAFKSQFFLNSFETKVTSFGGSIDIILSKYLKTDFTIPILGLEAKMMSVSRTILPDTTNIGLAASESILAFGGSLGFTIFIFDINVGYSHAKDFSTVYTRLRFHFPIIKF